MARAGLDEEPVVAAPKGLAPILRFRRPLPASALASVRRALDEDGAFRDRVRAAADLDPGLIGEAGRMLLARPEGWLEGLADLEAAASAAAASAVDEAEERSARRRLRSVEEAARAAEARVVALQAEVAGLRAELASARRGEAAAEAARAAVDARVAGLEKERDAAHRKVAALDREVARLGAERAPAPAVMPEPEPEPKPEPVSVALAEPAPAPFPVGALREAVEDAAAAAATLGRALDAAAAALDAGGPGRRPAEEGGRPRPRPRPRRARPALVRLPAPIPPGLFDDEPATAGHLVRVPGCVLVVDGYNASLRRWPDLPIAEQRRRLVDALGGLAARCGAQVQVVFDGADDGARTGGDGRRGVRVTFSAGEVEADEVILELVDRLPVTGPVVVATDDRRVRREAAARGANVVSQEQLFSLL